MGVQKNDSAQNLRTSCPDKKATKNIFELKLIVFQLPQPGGVRRYGWFGQKHFGRGEGILYYENTPYFGGSQNVRTPKKKDPLFYFRKSRRIWTALNLTNPPSFWLGHNYFGSKVTALSVKNRPYLRFTQKCHDR